MSDFVNIQKRTSLEAQTPSVVHQLTISINYWASVSGDHGLVI